MQKGGEGKCFEWKKPPLHLSSKVSEFSKAPGRELWGGQCRGGAWSPWPAAELRGARGPGRLLWRRGLTWG